MVGRSNGYWWKPSVNSCIKLFSKFRVCTTSGIHVFSFQENGSVGLSIAVLIGSSAKCFRSGQKGSPKSCRARSEGFSIAVLVEAAQNVLIKCRRVSPSCRSVQNYVCVPSVIRVECQYERCLGAGQNSWNTGCLCLAYLLLNISVNCICLY